MAALAQRRGSFRRYAPALLFASHRDGPPLWFIPC
jgi:hypothetical protein